MNSFQEEMEREGENAKIMNDINDETYTRNLQRGVYKRGTLTMETPASQIFFWAHGIVSTLKGETNWNSSSFYMINHFASEASELEGIHNWALSGSDSNYQNHATNYRLEKLKNSYNDYVYPVSYTHLPSPRDQRGSRMPSSA